jgi:integrase
MARQFFRLTEKTVRYLDAPGYHADGGGLYLQVSRAGTKSWIFRFTLKGRTRDMGLGPIRSVTLAAVRARAAECRMMVERGVDPIEEVRREEIAPPPAPLPPAGPTFREFAEKYIADHRHEWRNEKHADQWGATLAKFAYPVLGVMQLDEIDTPAVLRVLEPIWQSVPETAGRLRGRIERVLASAAVRGLRPATNPAAWAGHLREALPRKPKSKPFASLPYRAVPAFVGELVSQDSMSARCLEFLILTVARSGEARGARWSEVDVESKTWTVPADRMKASRPHVVPLSDAALAVIEKVRPLRYLAGGFLFPGVKSGRALSDMTLSAALRRMELAATVHGFRASFKTWAEQETWHANVVIEAALAHIVGDKAERSYMRGDWLEKRRALLDDWAVFCTAPKGTNVVRFLSDSAESSAA